MISYLAGEKLKKEQELAQLKIDIVSLATGKDKEIA